MPVFWGYLCLMITHTIESYWISRQSQSYKYEEFAKITNFWILKQTLHTTHLLKLLDKMCKYEMDLTSIVEDTERTQLCPQMDRRTDKVKPVYPLSTLLKSGGIISYYMASHNNFLSWKGLYTFQLT